MPAIRLLAGVFLLCLAPIPPAGADVYAPVVPELGDGTGVVAAMRSQEARELPVEALAAYTDGVEAWHAGRTDEAVARMELAALLDPAFPEPHLARARMLVLRNPRGAFDSITAAARASVSTFAAQHLLAVNAGIGLLLLTLGVFLVLVLYSVLLHISRFHHSVSEVLGGWFPGHLAPVFAGLLLTVPFLWQVGLLPVGLLTAGLLWPWMRRGERLWIAGSGAVLLVTPFVLWGTSPLVFGPLDPASESYLLARGGHAAYSPELARALTEARASAPRDPDLCFVLASLEKRGRHYEEAERLYEESLELGAREFAVQNNLGVVAFLEGEYNRALDLLQRSVANDDARAAAHFNLSQTYAKKLYFEKADQELLQANRLSIDRVRAALRDADGDPRRTLMDEGLPSSTVWRAAAEGPRRMPALPGALWFLFPGSLWLFPFLGAGAFGLGFRFGRRLHRHLPASACANCGRPVCRRCLKRIHQETYCGPCGDVLLRIQSVSYSKLVLDSQARRKRRVAAAAIRASAWAFPGLHAARRSRHTLAALLVAAAWTASLWFFRGTGPITRLAWLDGMPSPWWPEVPAAGVAVTFLLSGITVLRMAPKAPRVPRRDPTADPGWTDEAPPRAA